MIYRSGCTGLVDLQINPAEMGDGVFEGCTALETVNLASDCRVNRIGKDCFRGCTRLSSFQCPLTVNVIDDRAFADCSSLTSVCPAWLDYSTQMGKDVYLHDDMLFHKPMPKK